MTMRQVESMPLRVDLHGDTAACCRVEHLFEVERVGIASQE